MYEVCMYTVHQLLRWLRRCAVTELHHCSAFAVTRWKHLLLFVVEHVVLMQTAAIGKLSCDLDSRRDVQAGIDQRVALLHSAAVVFKSFRR